MFIDSYVLWGLFSYCLAGKGIILEESSHRTAHLPTALNSVLSSSTTVLVRQETVRVIVNKAHLNHFLRVITNEFKRH